MEGMENIVRGGKEAARRRVEGMAKKVYGVVLRFPPRSFIRRGIKWYRGCVHTLLIFVRSLVVLSSLLAQLQCLTTFLTFDEYVQ